MQQEEAGSWSEEKLQCCTMEMTASLSLSSFMTQSTSPWPVSAHEYFMLQIGTQECPRARQYRTVTVAWSTVEYKDNARIVRGSGSQI